MKKLLLMCLLLASPTILYAQDSRPVEENKAEDTVVIEDEPGGNTGMVNIRAGIDLTTHYFARGIMVENQGAIGQPWAQVELHFYRDPGGWVSDVHGFARTWSSFHSGPTGAESNASSSPSSWYETQFTAGLSLTLKNFLTVWGGYTMVTSPNDQFTTFEETFVSGSINDKQLWGLKGDWVEFDGLRIFGGFVWETNEQRDNGDNRGVYAEVGAKPGITLTMIESLPIKLSVPFKIGFNIFEYYEVPNKGDAPFGYTDVGIEGEVVLNCIPSQYGQWSLYAVGHWIYQDQNLARLNNSLGDDKNILFAMGGIRFSY